MSFQNSKKIRAARRTRRRRRTSTTLASRALIGRPTRKSSNKSGLSQTRREKTKAQNHKLPNRQGSASRSMSKKIINFGISGALKEPIMARKCKLVAPAVDRSVPIHTVSQVKKSQNFPICGSRLGGYFGFWLNLTICERRNSCGFDFNSTKYSEKMEQD